MARKQPVPGDFNPGDIPMSATPASQQVAQPQPQQPTYTEDEVVEHSALVRLKTRKETVLRMLHENALGKNQVFVANTLAFIMVDYGFISQDALNPEQEKE